MGTLKTFASTFDDHCFIIPALKL